MLNSDITDRIRRQLGQRDGMTPETLEPLALEYNRECIEVNRRLAECVSLLRQGLRSEAIQRANQKPNLLEVSAYLDFPELQEWLDILQLLGIKAPTLLDVDAAEQVREAFYDEQPLEALLKRQRQLAIGKAPLAWRLKVLRAIRRIDNANSVWAEDQEQWEIYRLKQITRELEVLEQSGDLERCQALAVELEADDWIVKPDPRSVAKAREHANRLLFSRQKDALEEISDPFYSAMCDLDLEKGRDLYAKWKQICAKMSTPPPAEIIERVAPAIEWIEHAEKEAVRKAEHARACAALSSLLDQPRTTLHQLELAYNQVRQHQLGMEEALVTRLQQRINSIHRRARNKLVLLVTAIFAFVLISGIAAFSWLSNQRAKAELAAADEQLTQMLSQAEDALKKTEYKALDASIKQADSFLKDLQAASPYVASRTTIKSLITQRDKLAADLQELREQLKKVLEELQHEIDTVTFPNDQVKLQGAIKLASQLGEEIGDLEKRYSTAQATSQSKTLDEEVTKLVAQRRAIEDNPGSDKNGVDDSIASVSKLVDVLKTTRTRYSYADSQTVDKLSNEIAACEALKSKLGKSVINFSEQDDYKRLILESQSLEEYAKGIESFVSANPNSSKTPPLRRASGMSKNWSVVSTFLQTCQSYSNGFPAKLGTAKADSSLSAFRRATDNLRINSKTINDSYALTFEYLSDFTQRTRIINELITTIENDPLANSKTIVFLQPKSTKAERGFIDEDDYALRKKALASVKAETTTKLELLTGGSMKLELAMRGPYKLYTEPSVSYSQVTQKLSDIKSKSLHNWEYELFNVMTSLCNADELDYRVKLRLLGRIMKASMAGSSICSEKVDRTFADNLVALADTPKDQLYSPQAFTTAMSEETVKRLRVFQTACEKGLDEVVKQSQQLGRLSIEFVGAVQRLEDSDPSAWVTKNARLKTGAIYALVPLSTGSTVQNLIPYGKLESGRIVQSATAQIPVGTPLFLVSAR